jgi:hypothetical protein
MAEISTPTQVKHIDSFNQPLYDWNTVDSNVYLSRLINSLCKAYGNDFIVSGMTLKDLKKTGTEISVKVLPGYAIQDSTLVEILETTELTFDVAQCSDQGYLVIYLRYQWSESPEFNPVELRIGYHREPDVNAGIDEEFINYGWDKNRDRTIVGVISFLKDLNNDIISLTLSQQKDFTIYGKSYNVRNRKSSPLFELLHHMGVLLEDDGDIPEYSENRYNVRAVNGNMLFSYQGVFVPSGKKLLVYLKDGTPISLLLAIGDVLIFERYDGVQVSIPMTRDENGNIIGLPVYDYEGNLSYLQVTT